MKEANYWKMITTVLSLEVSKGHLKWRITDLARQAKVSRTLVYYHLGKSKSEIVNECLDRVADEFYGLNEERMKLVMSGRLKECVNRSQIMFQRYPEFIIFYFKWRMKSSPLQKKLIEIEMRYQNKLRMLFPRLKEDELVAFHAVMQGLVSTPFITPEIFDKAIAMLKLPL